MQLTAASLSLSENYYITCESTFYKETGITLNECGLCCACVRQLNNLSASVNLSKTTGFCCHIVQFTCQPAAVKWPAEPLTGQYCIHLTSSLLWVINSRLHRGYPSPTMWGSTEVAGLKCESWGAVRVGVPGSGCSPPCCMSQPWCLASFRECSYCCFC